MTQKMPLPISAETAVNTARVTNLPTAMRRVYMVMGQYRGKWQSILPLSPHLGHARHVLYQSGSNSIFNRVILCQAMHLADGTTTPWQAIECALPPAQSRAKTQVASNANHSLSPVSSTSSQADPPMPMRANAPKPLATPPVAPDTAAPFANLEHSLGLLRQAMDEHKNETRIIEIPDAKASARGLSQSPNRVTLAHLITPWFCVISVLGLGGWLLTPAAVGAVSVLLLLGFCGAIGGVMSSSPRFYRLSASWRRLRWVGRLVAFGVVVTLWWPSMIAAFKLAAGW
jgi:hypothetical protein